MIFPQSIRGKYRWFVGIDPGLKGAYAVLDADGNLVRADHLPHHPIRNGKNVVQEPSPLDLLGALTQFPPTEAIVLMEEPISVRGQGLGSTSVFKYNGGLVAGALLAANYCLLRCYPIEWKRAMNLVGKVKRDSKATAESWFGQKFADHNVAEAALMALWLYRLCKAGRFPDVQVVE